MNKLNAIYRHRFGPVALTLTIVSTIGFLVRLFLLVMSWKSAEIHLLTIPGIFLIGFFYDLVVGLFFAVPVLFYCWLMKDSWYVKKFSRSVLFVLFTFYSLILIMIGVSEITFWVEFNVRFNFIAVDYLIYTTEVVGNIWESYNVPVILAGVALLSAIAVFLMRQYVFASQHTHMRFFKRTIWFLSILIVTAAGYFLVNNRIKNFSNNNFVNELAGNGTYEFGAAYWNNEIDYDKFYVVHDNKKNIAILKQMLNTPGVQFINDSLSVERKVKSDSPEKKMNLVLVSVESLSGDYLKRFGNEHNITPFLDSLSYEGLFFSNFYASGTRTVRGLEALSLAIPPTPGQSIVRRPKNEQLFTIGNVLNAKGYDVKYIYGGNSFFDNMEYFFSNNGYEVVDQKSIPESMIHHKTVWGVADEDAFDKAIQECDKTYKEGKLFFNHIMTVSNHRPYTYPEGRIDIPPSSHSMDGAVKYTDYAIHRFIQQARSKPWFANTIFVIVSDHCSRSAGKTDLPINRYHIPCLIYSPGFIQPKEDKRLMSQIDLAPTLLGLLNLNYTSKFLGYDINKVPAGKERLFISTYQDMGYVKSDTLTILSPQKKISTFKIDFKTGAARKIENNPLLSDEAVAWYQTAGFLFHSGKYQF